MIDLTQFTPWTLFTDLGFISILLLVGKFIRVKVKLIQQLFIPPSLIAGLLGLAFGPNGLGWIPLSNDLGTYAAILWQQPTSQFVREIVEIRDKSGLFMLGRPFDHQ